MSGDAPAHTPTAAGNVLRQSRAMLLRDASDHDAHATEMEKQALIGRARSEANREKGLQLAHAIRVLEGPNAPIDILPDGRLKASGPSKHGRGNGEDD